MTSTSPAPALAGCADAPSKTNDKGGVLDALANYWLTKIAFEDSGNTLNVPEFCLGDSAEPALHALLGGRELQGSFAFDLGLEIAGILYRNPWSPTEQIRAAIAYALEHGEVK